MRPPCEGLVSLRTYEARYFDFQSGAELRGSSNNDGSNGALKMERFLGDFHRPKILVYSKIFIASAIPFRWVQRAQQSLSLP